MKLCKDMTEMTTEALEGELHGGDALAYRFHLAICSFCRAHRRQVEKTIAVLGALPRPEASEEVREKALEAFRKKKRGA